MKEKFILDPTCSGRSIWFNKNHPNVIYTDIRKEEKGFIKERPNFEVNPDLVADFKDLPFKDKKFKLITWDPPHIKGLNKNGWPFKKYGTLGPTWKIDIAEGFKELWRVLDDYGILILKWSVSAEGRPDRDVSMKQLLEVIPEDPLFGHTSGSKSNTMWFSFMKIPGPQ